MAFCYTSCSLLATYYLTLILSNFVPQLEAQPTVTRRDSDPVHSFEAKATYFPWSSDNSEAFGIPVDVGDTRTYLHLDSGGQILWVLSNLLPEDQYQSSVKYDVGDRETCPFEGASYGDGLRIEGELVNDFVEIVPRKVGLEDTFLAAKEIEPEDRLCAHSVISGNIGFNFAEGSWIRTAYLRGLIKPVFKFSLQLPEPRITISLDANSVSTGVTWFPRKESESEGQEDFWSFSPQGDIPYVIDSGSGFLRQPLDVARKYYKDANLKYMQELQNVNDPDTTWWLVGCEYGLPDFHFKIGDIDITIAGSDIKGPEYMGTEGPEWEGMLGRCLTHLLAYDNSPPDEHDQDKNPDKSPYFGLGTPFLKNYQVYFDMTGDGRIGIKKP